MKPNQYQTSRSATAARILFITTLMFCSGVLPSLQAQAVPDRMNYQGILLNGQGAPITTPTDVQFRIWDSAALTDTNGLKWGRMFRITPDTNGAFNVVLSQEGALVSDAPDVSLSGVFTSVGSDSRYLELTVAGSTAIRPRQRLVAAPYALLAGSALNVVDGTIVNADISPSAAIADAKLATITTAGKVADSALSGNVALRNGGNYFTGNQTISYDGGGSGLEVDVPAGATAFTIVGTGTGANYWRLIPATSGNLVLYAPGLRQAVFAQDGSTYFGGAADEAGLAAALTVKGLQAPVGAGNVGIGTINPAAKLQVIGDVKLGPSGQYQAVAGEEAAPLRMVRGNVAVSGSPPVPTIMKGTGFSVVRTIGTAGEGVYTITFNPAFTDTPTFIANATYDASSDAVSVIDIGNNYVKFHIGARGGGWTDVSFNFIAVGPR